MFASGTLRKVRILGAGSYGVVYLDESVNPNGERRQIAVKTAELEEASSLAKEYKIYEALNGCPEIVRCYSDEVRCEKRQWVYKILLEYASAGTLKDLIRKSGGNGLPELDVGVFTRMILKGLDFTHSKGYVHCDLKPENILAFPADNGDGYKLKLADFGLAKEPGEETETEIWRGRFRGTASYMSPESVKVGVIGPALDVWSLGCVVLNMLTGKSQWQALFGDAKPNTQEFRAALVCYGVRPWVPENLSGKAKDFLNRCLETTYRHRWTAEMLLHHPFVSID